MEIRQLIRLLTYAYINLLPSILSYWMVTILPEILEQNLKLTDPDQRSRAGGFFFTSFYTGMIIGSFIWPKTLDFISKRNAILLGLVFQGIFNALTGQTSSLNVIFFYRFMTGMFQNLNTVGKDFVFEFAKPGYRQYAYSLKTFFNFIGSLAGPFLGYYAYLYSGKSLTTSLIYVSELYAGGIVLFFIIFLFLITTY